MNINWKLRLQNKVTLTAIIVTVIALVYKVFAAAGYAPAVPEAEVIEIAEMVVYLLALMGIVIDPTTEGASDSVRALHYDSPAIGDNDYSEE